MRNYYFFLQYLEFFQNLEISKKSCDVAVPSFSLLKVLYPSNLFVVCRWQDFWCTVLYKMCFSIITSVTYLQRLQLLLMILKLLDCWNDFTCTQVSSYMRRRKLDSRTANNPVGFESRTRGRFWNFTCKIYIWKNLKVYRFIFWRKKNLWAKITIR